MAFAKKIQTNTYVINLWDLESTTGRILLQILHLQTGGCNPRRLFNALVKAQKHLPQALFIIVSSSHYRNTLLAHSQVIPCSSKPLTLRFKVDYVAGLSLLCLR